MTQLYRKHIDGQNVAELRNWLLNPKAADPGTPVESAPWINTTDKRIRYFNGTATETVAFLSDVTSLSTYRGDHDASTGIPTPATSVRLPNEPITAGDWWRVSVSGTIAGLQSGADVLQVGDVIFASADNAAAAGQFFASEANAAVATATALDTVVLAALPALTATAVASTLTSVHSVKVYDAAGNDETESYDILLGATNATLTSLTAETNLSLRFIGTA